VAAGYLARPERTVARPPAETERASRICVEPARSEQPPSCEEVDLATRWCEARLATMEAPARLRLTEPEPQPELDRQVRAAFASCGIAAEPVQTDCRELPCVVSMRLRDLQATHEAMKACAPLARLGFEETEDFSLILQQWPVRCPDGTTETMGMLARTTDLEPLIEELVPPSMEDELLSGGYYALGQMGRRAEQLARSWPCGG
jgi:hypothetical protein